MRIERAIAVAAQRDGNPALTKLAHLLADAEISVDVVASLEDASAAILLADDPPAIALLTDAKLSDDLTHLRGAVPHATPVAFYDGADADVVKRAFRGGAFDFIDLAIDSGAAVLAALERAVRESRARVDTRQRVSAMRAVVEDFLRVLVKAERRSIDLEEKLRQSEGGDEPPEVADPDADRPACVLVVDDDESVIDLLVDILSRDGLTVKSAMCGEDAIEIVGSAVNAGQPIDLIVVDKNLPDVDGIRVINRVRGIEPTLAAMVMTGFASTESAIDAADLGVVGYVLKPFDDVQSLVRRVREVADRAMHERRERRYLARIKQRHSEFLLRYRKLAAQFEKL